MRVRRATASAQGVGSSEREEEVTGDENHVTHGVGVTSVLNPGRRSLETQLTPALGPAPASPGLGIFPKEQPIEGPPFLRCWRLISTEAGEGLRTSVCKNHQILFFRTVLNCKLKFFLNLSYTSHLVQVFKTLTLFICRDFVEPVTGDLTSLQLCG